MKLYSLDPLLISQLKKSCYSWNYLISKNFSYRVYALSPTLEYTLASYKYTKFISETEHH